MNFKELEDFFSEADLPTEPVELSQSMVVFDHHLFVENSLNTLRSHPGNKAYMQDYNRLIKYHKLITTGEIS